jgi:hypothetical protein
MPWSTSDVESHKKGLTPDQKKRWVEIANSALQSCMSKGGIESECAVSAIRQANGVVGHADMINVHNTNYVIRRTTIQGRQNIIVPVIMMVEGVHNGSQGPLYHPASELGRTPEAWNGMPVVIDHPRDNDGENISANSPDIVPVGRIYHSRMNGTKLMGDVYLDEELLRNISPVALSSILNGETLEVSIGVFTDEEETQGIWNNEQYNAIARNHRPDHLALLPGGIGACSWNDGCGIRANSEKQKGGNNSMDINETVTGMEAKRKELGMSPAEFYAVPRDPPSDSKLPIFDAAHVRNALARFNQVQGLSPEERASAKRKILAKANHFGIDASSMETNMQNNTFQSLQSVKEVGLFNTLVSCSDEGLIGKIDVLRKKVDSLDSESALHYLQEVYENYAVYEVKMRQGGSKFFKQEYTLNDEQVNFTGNPEQVKRKVEYIPITHVVRNLNNKGGSKMSEEVKPCGQCMEKVVAIIQSNATPFTEADREWLLKKDEAYLNQLLPKTEPVVNKEKPVEVTKEMIINAMSDEDKAALAYGKKQLVERRNQMVKGIQDNAGKETWTDDILATMSEDMLERVYNSVKKEEEIVDYSVLGSGFKPNFGNNGAEVEPLLPAGIELETKK